MVRNLSSDEEVVQVPSLAWIGDTQAEIMSPALKGRVFPFPNLEALTKVPENTGFLIGFEFQDRQPFISPFVLRSSINAISPFSGGY